MTSIVIVEKNGDLKDLKWKSFNHEEIYKKAGFKTNKDFKEKAKWVVKLPNDGGNYCVKMYAKEEGRANQENKYDFPPPVDTKLYFGSCVLINYENESSDASDVASQLTVKEWNKIYEHLFGGFEDLGAEDSEEDAESDEYDDLEKTKEGYAKDDFIVDDDEEIEYEAKPKKKRVLNRSNRSHLSTESEEEFEYDSELSEEEYI